MSAPIACRNALKSYRLERMEASHENVHPDHCRRPVAGQYHPRRLQQRNQRAANNGLGTAIVRGATAGTDRTAADDGPAAGDEPVRFKTGVYEDDPAAQAGSFFAGVCGVLIGYRGCFFRRFRVSHDLFQQGDGF